MIIDITSFGEEPSLDQPNEGGVIDITPEGFNSPKEPEIIDITPEEDSEETDDEEVDIEEDEEQDQENESDESDDDDEEDEDEYSEARQYFEQATTLNILQTPEDFEWDENDPLGSIEKATEYTNQVLLQKVEENFYSQFKDPLLQQIVDTAIKGGSFLDVTELVNKTNDVSLYENMDITDEDDASKLYEEYLKETTKFKSSKINRLIDIAKEDDELVDLAAEAKEYFIEKNFQKIKQQVEQAEQMKKQQEQQAKQYWTGFNQTLESSNLNTSLKERVMDSFSLVENNGQKTLKYQDTFNRVSQNPQHFIDLLVFLNSYDPEQGFNFEREVKKVATKQANSFKERLEKAITTKTSAGKSTTKNKSKIVPKKSDYQKNIRRY
jgi:hypothetical protein